MERDEFSFCAFCEKIKNVYKEIRNPENEQQVESFLNNFLVHIFSTEVLTEKDIKQFINRKNKCYKRNAYPFFAKEKCEELIRDKYKEIDTDTGDLCTDLAIYDCVLGEDANINNEENRSLLDDKICQEFEIVYNCIPIGAPISSMIYFYIIHGIFGKLECKKLNQKKLPYLDRKLGIDIHHSWNLVWVKGERYSGKTRFLFEYLDGKDIIYIRQPKSYKEVYKQLQIEEDRILKKDIRQIMEIDELFIWEQKKERLKWLIHNYDIIIEAYNLNNQDLEEIQKLSEIGTLRIFIEVGEGYNIPPTEKRVIAIRKFDEIDTFELFNLICGDDWRQVCERDEHSSSIIKGLCKVVYYNPVLITLVAQRFKNKLPKETDKNQIEKVELALEDLEYICSFHANGEKDNTLSGDEYYSAKYPDRRGTQLNLCGHIREFFRGTVPEMERHAFYILSLLSGIELKQENLVNWFNIEESIINDLVNNGWCYRREGTMVLEIPEAVAEAFKDTGSKDIMVYPERTKDKDGFWTYIINFCDTLNRKEFECTDVSTVREIIFRIHDVFQERLMSKCNNSVLCEFHFACYRYFLLYGDSQGVKKLNSTVDYKKIVNCEGSEVYQETLNLIRNYMGQNCIDGLEKEVDELYFSYGINKSYFLYYALVDMIQLAFEKNVTELLSISLDMLFFHNHIPHKGYEGMQILLENKIHMLSNLASRIRDICDSQVVEYDFYLEYVHALYDAVYNANKIIFDDGNELIKLEKKLLLWFQNSSYNERKIGDVESELIYKSYMLLLWDLYWLQCLFFDECLAINYKIKGLVLKYVEEIQELKRQLLDMPITISELTQYALIIAGMVLQKKELLSIDKLDYRYVTMEDNKKKTRLDEVISKYDLQIQTL